MILHAEREMLVRFGQALLGSGLTTGTGGNLSLYDRAAERIAITPSGIRYETMTPAQIVLVDRTGRTVEGECRPSSELALHLALYAARPDVGAVVHTHSPYATTLACLRRPLPAVHYLVAFAGHEVPLAPYATFGTPELARHVTASIGAGQAVLLANHGLVAVGADLEGAFAVAEEIELVARLYLQARAVGEPVLLSREEIEEVQARLRTYGQPSGEGEGDGGVEGGGNDEGAGSDGSGTR